MRTFLLCCVFTTILNFLLLTNMVVGQDETDDEEEDDDETTDSPSDETTDENIDAETTTSSTALTDAEIIKAIAVLNVTNSNDTTNQPLLKALMRVLAERAKENENSELEEVEATTKSLSSTTPIITYDIAKIIGQVGDIVVRATHANLSSLGDNNAVSGSNSNGTVENYTSVQSVMSSFLSSFGQWAGGRFGGSQQQYTTQRPIRQPTKIAVAGKQNLTI